MWIKDGDRLLNTDKMSCIEVVNNHFDHSGDYYISFAFDSNIWSVKSYAKERAEAILAEILGHIINKGDEQHHYNYEMPEE